MRIHFFLASLLVLYLSSTPAQQPSEPATKSIEGHWKDLAVQDAAKAYQAIWALIKTPRETVAYMEQHLKPAVAPEPRKVEDLIDDLNSENFSIRDKANRELVKLDRLAESALKKKLSANLSLETRQRIEKLLGRLLGPISASVQLQSARAVETLELIGSDAAKALLTKIAAGAPERPFDAGSQRNVGALERAEPSAFKPSGQRTDLYDDPLPNGTVGRLGTLRFRRNEPYAFGGVGLTFYPDGKSMHYPGWRARCSDLGFPQRSTFARGFGCSPLYSWVRGGT